MIGTRLLARNALWNLMSLAAPMLVALVAIPALIKALDADRFAILTLAWMVIGYCSLFDFGLGRALTKLVSEEDAQENRSELPAAVWTALFLMFVFGCAGGLTLAGVSSVLSRSVLKIPEGLQDETATSLRWIAMVIPVVTLTAGLRGILEARQRFGPISVIRAMMGVCTFAGPLAAAKLGGGLPAVIATIAAIRMATLTAYVFLCGTLTPELFTDRTIRFQQAKPLFRFGSWLTVSNLISPLMTSMDRFLVGMLLPVTYVGYYAVPYEIVTKLQLIPTAVTGVLFPAFSTSLVNDPDHAQRLYTRGLYGILAIIAPLAAIVAALAYPGLRFWLGEDFANHGYRVMQLLAAGVLINAAANIPSSYLQASGRPDLNAKLHMIELPLYVPLAIWLIKLFGIEGAALAWVLRVALDTSLLFWMAHRSRPAPVRMEWEVANAGTAASRASQ